MTNEILHLKDFFPFLGQDGCDPTLELYLPRNLSEMHRERRKHPCLLICPGGGYMICSQRESEPIALHFLPEGFNVFVLTYSVPGHRFPTQLIEAAAAVELIVRHADEWNCDTEKLCIMGFSAGAHLAASYCTMFDSSAVRAVFPDSRQVSAALLCYPVITADPAWSHKGSFEALLGTEARTDAEIDAFSCDRLVNAHTPPAFLWHTASDPCVPVMNSLLYAQALARNGIPFELHVYPYGAHGLSTCDGETNDHADAILAYDAQWLPAAKKWLRLILDL